MELDLEQGIGEIDVDCVVDGQVTKRRVVGVIGSGEQAKIRAVSRVGSIGLICR